MAEHRYIQEKPDNRIETEAICAQVVYDGQVIEPDMWFDQSNAGQKKAVALCHQCPLILQCAAWATDRYEEFGVWGGLTADDRRKLRKRTSRKGIPNKKH